MKKTHILLFLLTLSFGLRAMDDPNKNQATLELVDITDAGAEFKSRNNATFVLSEIDNQSDLEFNLYRNCTYQISAKEASHLDILLILSDGFVNTMWYNELNRITFDLEIDSQDKRGDGYLYTIKLNQGINKKCRSLRRSIVMLPHQTALIKIVITPNNEFNMIIMLQNNDIQAQNSNKSLKDKYIHYFKNNIINNKLSLNELEIPQDLRETICASIAQKDTAFDLLFKRNEKTIIHEKIYFRSLNKPINKTCLEFPPTSIWRLGFKNNRHVFATYYFESKELLDFALKNKFKTFSRYPYSIRHFKKHGKFYLEEPKPKK